MKIEIKHKITGIVIFSHEHDNNSIKNTIEFAVKNKNSVSFANLRYANLIGANLRYADLRYADLRYADLRYANLSGANLSDADLSGANLSGANLSDADLSGANLSDADLSGANLRRVIGNMIEIKTLFLSHYVIVFTKNVLAIGCKQFTHQEWRKFDDKTIAKMDSNALEFWKKWKEFIFQAIKLSFE